MTIKLTVLLTGDKGFEVHRTGCRDIARTKRTGKVQNEFPFEATDERSAVLDLWSDQIAENPDTADNEDRAYADYLPDTKFHGCCKLPANAVSVKSAEGSGNRETPKASAKQAAKRELATLVVEQAYKAVLKYCAENTDMTQEEAAKFVSHWLHHLPADRERWVAAGLPKPDRSDWR
jgi:hypothetical protein